MLDGLAQCPLTTLSPAGTPVSGCTAAVARPFIRRVRFSPNPRRCRLFVLSIKRRRLLKKSVAAVGWAVARKDDSLITRITHDLASRNEVNETLLPCLLRG